MVVEKRLYTVEEYRAVADRPENRAKILELIEGEIVEKVPIFTPSRIAARIVFFIMQYLMKHPIG
jgi:Uma2 family endonuclease